ncbi:MAG: hypothetical protein GTO14_12940 [Anaerolineales bacterium]|nr:hypothetical protein [Anaerolineales bacterium]
MNTEIVLPLSDDRAELSEVGGKGASLAKLSAAGLPVPEGFHVTTTAYREFVNQNELQDYILTVLEGVDVSRPVTLERASNSIGQAFDAAQIPSDVAHAIIEAYASFPGIDPAVAVRSSATAEDLPEASFAGQQETYLNVRGADALLEAIKKCWASLWTTRAISYRARQGILSEHVSMAAIVQVLVPAEAAGILFTANPINGRRDQLIINAAWGLGEAVVGGLVTPDTYIMDKETGREQKREIADKQVMTVRIANATEEQPVAENLRRVPVLDEDSASELTQLGVKIEEIYQMPMDVEWAIFDGKYAILQARPITALPEPEPDPPTEWKLPKGNYAALRNNIVELMADPLTPLFGSLGLAAVNTSMNRLLEHFFGRPDLMPEGPIILVNSYAYYNGSLKPWQIAQILFRSVGIAKRMFRGAVERWTQEGRPQYLAAITRWEKQDWRTDSSSNILAGVRELAEAAIDAYLALVSGVLPAAWISEGLFTLVYNILIKRRKDPSAPIFLLGFDSLPIQAEKSLYDQAVWARGDKNLAAYLQNTPTEQQTVHLESGEVPPDINPVSWGEWRTRFSTHMRRFGHMIYNLDFGNPVPADDPRPILETIRLYISGRGVDPHSRQQAAAEQREQAVQATENRLKRLRRNLFRKFLTTAQRYAPLREDGLADIGLCYPLLRQMLREIGSRFIKAGMIEDQDDIFWLNQDEVERATELLDRGGKLNDMSAVIPQRKAAWYAARRISPPVALPKITVPGISKRKTKARRGRGSDWNTLKGVAASSGRSTATARVLHGPEDFDQMDTGDVLVAAITTPAWTPLFARAAAVVTDVGGPLSHGSIVAREYGIPAVLGTGQATRTIRSGQIITVDGNEGIVYLSDGGSDLKED